MIETKKEYFDLLKFNLNNFKDFDENIVKTELDLYLNTKLDKEWENYTSDHNDLSTWKETFYKYPDLNPMYKKLIADINRLGVKKVCEIGAGSGNIVKYVYGSNESLDITAIEAYDKHYNQMIENFKVGNNVIEPFIHVPATPIKGLAQDLPLGDNSQDLIYTVTVMMHIPYLLAVKAIMEIAKTTSKYVIHVERKDGNVVMGQQKNSQYNNLHIDYKGIYEELGFKTLDYHEFPYTEGNGNIYNHIQCVYYLGEKI
jgi:phospholipid N-methyltransferase